MEDKRKIEVIMAISLLSAGCGVITVTIIPVASCVFLSIAIMGLVYLFSYFFEVGNKVKKEKKQRLIK